MIELSRTYKMHILVFEMITLNLIYGPSKVAIQIPKVGRVHRQKLADLTPSKIFNLNTSCDSAP